MLQGQIELYMKRFTSGLDVTGPSQAKTTISGVLSSVLAEPITNLPGLFVSYNDGVMNDFRLLTTAVTFQEIAGVVVSNKLEQNAPANFGGTVTYGTGSRITVMTEGKIVCQSVGTIDVSTDIYINVDETSDDFGKLQNDALNGIKVGGPTYSIGANAAIPPVRVVVAEDGLCSIQFKF